VRAMFAQYSLTVTQVKRDGDVDQFCVSTQSRGVDQTSTIFRGGDEWTESFDTVIKYQESDILPEILGLLQHITGGYKTGKVFLVEVSDQDDQPIGVLRVKAGVICSLKGPKREDLDDVRKAFDEETIDDAKMWKQTKTMPERATPRLKVAKAVV